VPHDDLGSDPARHHPGHLHVLPRQFDESPGFGAALADRARLGGPQVLDFTALTVGFVVAAVVGVFALQLVLKLLYRARFRYFSFYVLALAAAPLAAQTPTGTLTGRVTAADQRPIAGAAVSIAERGVGALTNERGDFVLNNLPAGQHTLSVKLQAGQVARQHVVLEESAVELEGLSVSAVREGQARALAQQRMADNIVSVVSADGIGRFPDLNVADALNRVSGISLARFRGEGVNVNIRGAPPEFSNIAINGVVMPTGAARAG
jgi:hypothetical protein